MIMIQHRIFKVLSFKLPMCICYVFFFFLSQNKRRRTGKKVRLRVYKLYIIFSYKKNRDISTSLCGQESSIIQQCLATKC